MRPPSISTPSRRASSRRILLIGGVVAATVAQRVVGEEENGLVLVVQRTSPDTLTLRQSATQIAVTASIIQQIPDASACRNVSRTRCCETRPIVDLAVMASSLKRR